ncbi:MAG TPA: hypoxanthine phosphoribosyltransferase [Candidatus Binataceae bacterium]|nr:hypoxanthine phosphoribosyltransferase [Candidatus Binataceae bacterium]
MELLLSAVIELAERQHLFRLERAFQMNVQQFRLGQALNEFPQVPVHQETATISRTMEHAPQFTEVQIREAVRRIAREISDAHRDTCPVLVGVLKGSFVFMADLIRELTIPCEVDFIRARSYGTATSSSGSVTITKDVETDVRGRDVIVIEDIADTGLTLDTVVAWIRGRKAASVKRCALLLRHEGPQPDFVGFSIGPGFVIGYGLDYAEQYRGLREIRTLTEKG